MKKFFTKAFIACMTVLCCMGTEVNAQKKLCLKEIKTQMEGNYTYYGYNKDAKLDSVYQYLGYYDEEGYRLYKYDESGNMIKEEGYGILPTTDVNNTTFSKVFEVFYEFDANNKMTARRNYNIDEFSENHDFYLGGVYTYEYDTKGRLNMRKLFWDEEKTQLFEKTSYSYDENDRVVKEVYVTCGFYGESEDMHIEYYYDQFGNLTDKVTKTLDPNTGALEESARVIYKYDDNNNLLSRTSYDNINPEIPSQQHNLLYTDTLAADVAFPINYEDEMDFFVKSKSAVRQDSVYMRDAEGVIFQLFDVEDWTYAELEGSTGIENVVNPEMNISLVRDSEGNIMVNGLEKSENIRIYDINGKILRNACYNGKVNVSGLPKGMYILMTRQGNMKFSK